MDGGSGCLLQRHRHDSYHIDKENASPSKHQSTCEKLGTAGEAEDKPGALGVDAQIRMLVHAPLLHCHHSRILESSRSELIQARAKVQQRRGALRRLELTSSLVFPSAPVEVLSAEAHKHQSFQADEDLELSNATHVDGTGDRHARDPAGGKAQLGATRKLRATEACVEPTALRAAALPVSLICPDAALTVQHFTLATPRLEGLESHSGQDPENSLELTYEALTESATKSNAVEPGELFCRRKAPEAQHLSPIHHFDQSFGSQDELGTDAGSATASLATVSFAAIPQAGPQARSESPSAKTNFSLVTQPSASPTRCGRATICWESSRDMELNDLRAENHMLRCELNEVRSSMDMQLKELQMENEKLQSELNDARATLQLLGELQQCNGLAEDNRGLTGTVQRLEQTLIEMAQHQLPSGHSEGPSNTTEGPAALGGPGKDLGLTKGLVAARVLSCSACLGLGSQLPFGQGALPASTRPLHHRDLERNAAISRTSSRDGLAEVVLQTHQEVEDFAQVHEPDRYSVFRICENLPRRMTVGSRARRAAQFAQDWAVPAAPMA